MPSPDTAPMMPMHVNALMPVHVNTLTCCAGRNRVRVEVASGEIKERFKSGHTGLALRLTVGKDLLPDTLSTGCMLLQDGGVLVPFHRDALSEPPASEELSGFPAAGALSFVPIARRRGAGNSTGADKSDLQALVDEAVALVLQGEADAVTDTPFGHDADLGGYIRPQLEDVLQAVR